MMDLCFKIIAKSWACFAQARFCRLRANHYAITDDERTNTVASGSARYTG
jgi:hypothetical protein